MLSGSGSFCFFLPPRFGEVNEDVDPAYLHLKEGGLMVKTKDFKLRTVYVKPNERAAQKVMDHLDVHAEIS
jgi:hypothetical protein